MKEFVIKKRESLIRNLYANILEGGLKHRRDFNFFKEMNKVLRKSVEKCKSKFQKIEKKIYEEFLDIPEKHYSLYVYLRDKKQRENRNLKNIGSGEENNEEEEFEGKQLEMERVRNEIIFCIKKGSIKTFIEEKDLGKTSKLNFN